jgi:hypothetical protein
MDRRKAARHPPILSSRFPELNSDALLNQDVKSNAVGRKRAHILKEMLTHVRSFLWSRQRKPHIVKGYFQGQYVQYAAA